MKSRKQTTNFPSSNEDKKIFRAFNSGMKRSEIKKKYKITDTQFASIIKNALNNEMDKTIQAHPKHFKIND